MILRILSTVFVFLLIGISLFYFFVISPKVVSVSPLDRSSGISLDSPIIIKFDKPVKRQKINHFIIPEVYGEWKFEDPLIKDHFFRTLVFVPKIEFQSNTKYYVELDHIVTNLGIGEGNSFSFSFETKSDINIVSSSAAIFGDVNAGQIFSKIIKIFSFNPTNAINIYISNIKDKVLAILKNIKGSSNIIQSDNNNHVVLNVEKKNVALKVIKTPFYWQEYPLSCEAASLRMALTAKGVNVSENDIMEKIGYDKTAHIGNVWGNPYNAFVGSISGSICSTGYGVYWEPVAKAANYWRPTEYFSGWTLKQLINEIKLGNSVMFWGVLPTGRLTDCSWYTSEGDYIKAFKQTHVRVVVGFIGSSDNPTKIIIKDPLNGDLYWSVSEFLTNWKIYDNSGVVIK